MSARAATAPAHKTANPTAMLNSPPTLVDPEHHLDEADDEEGVREQLAEPDRGHADLGATNRIHR